MKKHLGQTGTALASMLLALAAGAAQTKPEQPPSSNAPQKTSVSPAKAAEVKPQDSTAAAPLTPEQAQLQAQIEKLYQLAQDLKAAVAKSSKDTLSVDVIKKADAVEKAAKNLKDQMKSSQPASDHR